MGLLSTIYKVKHGSEVFHMMENGVGFNVHQFACSVFRVLSDDRFHWSIHLKGWEDQQEENMLYDSGNSATFRGALIQKAVSLASACEEVFGTKDYENLIHEEYILSDDLKLEPNGEEGRDFLKPGWFDR